MIKKIKSYPIAKYSCIGVIVFLMSCSPWSSETDRALKLAGDNRAELEKVLKYYQEVNPDPLKLKAAEYLISNMIYQYSNFGPGVDSLNKTYTYIYGVYRKDRNSVFMSDSIKQKGKYKIDAEYDLLRLTSSHLIKQIESAFDTYNRFDWCRAYPFEIFCEYILPYKIRSSDSSVWRNHAYEKYSALLEYSSFKGSQSHYEAEQLAHTESLKVRVESASGSYAYKLQKETTQGLELNFHTKHDGRQLINIYYLNGHSTAATIRIMVDSMTIGDIVFPGTGSWQIIDKEVPPVEFTVTLSAGDHTLKLIPLDKSILVDYIYIPEYIHMKFPNSLIPEGWYYLTNSFGRVTIPVDTLMDEGAIKIHPNPSKGVSVKIVAKDGNLYQLIFEKPSGVKKAVDAFPFGDSDWVLTYIDHGYQNQQWAFVPVNDGYQIRNKETGKILAYRKSDSTLIQAAADLMQGDYIWRLEKVTGDVPPDSSASLDNAVRAAQKISEITNLFHWSGSYVEIGPISPIHILDYAYGSCVEETDFQTMLLRSMGVASTVDFVFNYPERNAGHTWSVIFDLKGNTIQNNCHNPVGAGTWVDVFAKGKVYRKTNTINKKSLLLINNNDEHIPVQFQNPYFIDVTREYCKVRDIEVDIALNNQTNNRFGYLMVFNNDHWVVIGWGEKANSNIIKFNDVEPGPIYLPAFYSNGSFEAFNKPFHFDSLGKLHFVNISKDTIPEISFRRKFPNRLVDESYHKLIVGGKFQGANKSDFSDAETIGTITDKMTEPIFHIIDATSKKTFKYLRYIGPDGGRCNINEIIFIDQQGDTINGKIIGTNGSFEHSGKTKEKVFDGDVLTYFDAPEPSGSWVGLQLRSSIAVSKIRFVARNDGNMVEIGDEYELSYWDNQKWISMGKKIATSDSVTYHKVPAGALYWLQNHTKGWEERIFTLDENREQVWW